MSSNLPVWINLSFNLFIFVQGLFHAVFSVKLGISAFINVSICKKDITIDVQAGKASTILLTQILPEEHEHLELETLVYLFPEGLAQWSFCKDYQVNNREIKIIKITTWIWFTFSGWEHSALVVENPDK